MVAYWFRSELAELERQFPHGRTLDTPQDVEDWNAGKVELLFVQPQSVKFGLNLQYGGHILVWFSLTWSFEAYQQLAGRLRRDGQVRPVIVHHLVARNTVDERMMRVLAGHSTVQQELLDATR